jgi:serine/threonine protein kinase
MLLLELADHGTLRDVLESTEALPWSQRCSFAEDLAHGLLYLHDERELIHRDIKSINLLVTGPSMSVKLTDFDKARRFVPDSMYLLDDTEITETYADWSQGKALMTSAVGTPLWTAVELLDSTDGRVRYGKAVDVFSYGIVLSEIATRKLPYDEHKKVQVMTLKKKIIAGLRPCTDEVPKNWRALMESCWHENPSQRPTMAQIVKDVLQLEVEC